MNLTQIAAKYETDKKTISSPSYESYLSVYDKIFAPMRLKEIILLEIGVLNGESLRLWRDYFPTGRIFGIDVDPSRQFKEERIEVVTGDQSSEIDLAYVWEKSGDFDVIIDDGSHINELTLASFKYLWPRLKSGGIYIIEDLGQSYGLTLTDVFGKWPGMEHNQRRDYENHREDMEKFFNKHIEDMDKLNSEIRNIEFWPRLAIFHKI